MSAKDIYCYRILKAYSLIVDFEGTVSRVNVPAPVDGETFKKWKERVLGSTVSNVTVFVPNQPSPQTKISTLQDKSGAEHLERVFRAFGKEKDTKKSIAVKDAVNKTERQLSTLSKNVLDDILAETDQELEPSVREFFQRFNENTDEDIDVESLIRDLVKTYNNSVRIARRLE